VAARCKAWTVFACSNAEIVDSNPTQGIDVCLWLFCLCCSVLGSTLATGWSPLQGARPTVLGLRNSSEAKRFADALRSKVGETGKREKEKFRTRWFLESDCFNLIGKCNDIVTCRTIAMEQVGKHVSVEMDSWKPTCYGTTFPSIKGTGDQQTFRRVRKWKMFSIGPTLRYITGNPDQIR
jgi:hypothetical protein